MSPTTPTPRLLRARFVALDETPSPPEGVVVYEAKDPGAAVDEAIASGEPAPYGAVLWDSAVELARRLHRADLQGRRVLELGCGCGLVGIVAARGGARVFVGDPERAGRDTFIRLLRDANVDVGFDGMVCVLVPPGAKPSELTPWR